MTISSPPRRGGQAAPHRQPALSTALVLAVVAVLVLAAAVVALRARGESSSSGVQGSGVAATQSRHLARFSRLDLAGSNNVTVVVGGRQSVVVHADSNLVRYVTTRVVAGTLVIGTTGSFTTRSPMGVEVSVPSLAAVTLSGSGVLSTSGTVTRLDASVGGSGLAQLTDLVARDVQAVVTGSGLIRVTATASLNAAVPGTGAIVYSGNPPRVTSSVTGTGAVTRG